MTLTELEQKVFIVFCATLPWLDLRFFPLSSAFVRPAALIPMSIGLVLMLLRPSVGLKMNLRFFKNLLPWVILALLLTAFSLIFLHAAPVVKERTRGLSAVREFSGLAVVLFGFTYIGHALALFDGNWQRPIKGLTFGVFASMTVGLIQMAWFFLKVEPFVSLGKLIQNTLLFHPQVGKVHGLTPEGSMYADLGLTVMFPLLIARWMTVRREQPNNKRSARRAALALGVCLLTLIGTSSRPGLVGLALSLLIGTVVTSENLGLALKRIVVLACTLVLMTGALLTLPNFRDLVSSSFSNFGGVEDAYAAENWSNITRAATQLAAVNILITHPTGIGLGQYMFFSQEAMPAWAFLSPEVQAMYGKYAQGSPYCAIIDCTMVYPDPKNMLLRIGLDWSPLALVASVVVWFSLLHASAKRIRHRYSFLAVFLFYSLLPMPILALSVSSYMWLHWMLTFVMGVYVLRYKAPEREAEGNPSSAGRIVTA